MTYYDERKNIEEYIEMAEGYDGSELIAILKEHLPLKSTVLELGMGPGTDLDLLAQSYKVTGSDFSSVFLDVYRETHPAADLLELDAVTLETERTFDCIYSNKVLQHLSKKDLQRSFSRQKELLNKNGLLMHSFWFGENEEEMGGLRHVYYTEAELLKTIGPSFDTVALERYKEFEDGDSFYILLRLQDK
ncbi:MAG: class I SAM-dependent methyltransferase [Chloroflexi bacterium]|nr:MAG: class I SAM-dependent methyltransferase [Chloroflexota bacterium]MBL1192931.1 class I SAM-dependent methyltransferase [Chloroflexota bacterium]NOH10224.1 class I SAM-dependent methyltransferase [Chloroflexota bacterium]